MSIEAKSLFFFQDSKKSTLGMINKKINLIYKDFVCMG